MRVLLLFAIVLILSSCCEYYEVDRKKLVFECTETESTFFRGKFNEEPFCYSNETGHISKFQTASTFITQGNTLEFDSTGTAIGIPSYHHLWKSTIDINNAAAFDHFITIWSPGVSDADSLKIIVSQSIIGNSNLLKEGFEIVFGYVDDENFQDGGGKSVPRFNSNPDEPNSFLRVKSLDTIWMDQGVTKYDITFEFDCELFYSDDSFGMLENCTFQSKFEL